MIRTEIRFRTLETPLGRMAFATGDHGLLRVCLPREDAFCAIEDITSAWPGAAEDDGLLPSFARQLERYFDGRVVRFEQSLDTRGCTEFTVQVWDACRAIPRGCTASYGELAERVGRPKAARAVGTAMRCNRFPLVVPCHRVVRSGGGLGGFAGMSGLDLKRSLLALEGACPVGAISEGGCGWS